MSVPLPSQVLPLALAKPVVGRFAPSPTGPLHAGSLVSAVGSYLLARSRGGSWLMRMEDLDAPRVVPGMADDILRTLEALGLQWDGEIMWQSRRTDAYVAALERLAAAGVVYHCGCSRSDIARAASAPHRREGGGIYPGTCRAGLPEGRERRSVRVKVPDEEIVFDDGIMGRLAENIALTSGDFIIRRADGPFAYQLAVVVDDADMGVTQVARGADLLDSTPRQIWLQRILDYPRPEYFHLPLVTGPDGSKLSKRDNALSITSGRNIRKEAGQLLLSALRFLGQDVPDSLRNASAAEVLGWGEEHFDAAAIPTVNGTFIS